MQIGPRIRVGGALGKAGQNVKKQAIRQMHQTGKILDNKWTKLALGAALTATGVGAVPGALLMAGTGAAGKGFKKGGNIGQAAKQGVVDGALSYGAAKLGGVLKGKPAMSGGVPNAGVEGLGGELDGVLSPGVLPSSANVASAAAEPSRFRQIASGVGEFLGKHKKDILDYGQAAEGVYGNYRNAKMQDEALAEYRRGQPLRDRSRSLLLDESRPDLSSVFADPNIRYRRVAAGG